MTRLLPSFKSVSFPRKIRRSSYICYFMPMGSQQTTISTCLHLSLRPLHILDMADVINVNVTYNKTKRIISYQKDGDVQGFCHLFLHVFSDVLPSKVTPIQVKFLQCDDKMGPEDYQELQNNDKLDDKKRLRAFIWKEEGIVKGLCCLKENSKVQIPWYPVEASISGGLIDYLRTHPVKINTSYRLWSLVSKTNDGIMIRDAKDGSVTCNGSFNMARSDDVRIEAIDGTRQKTFYVALMFKDTNAQKNYVLTGTGKGKQVKTNEVPVSEIISDVSVFEPLYFWSYTMFRNCFYRNCYLGCDHAGKTTLVENGDLSYPDPQTLFILNTF